MLIIRLKGGLGNQMFQYAFGRALSIRRKDSLYLDTSVFGYEPKIDTPRRYALDAFNIHSHFADQKDISIFNTKSSILIRKITRRLFRLNDFKYYRGQAHSKKTFLEGYWNNERYFTDVADIIRKDFTLKTPLGHDAETVARDIANHKSSDGQSVSLHVRRGDYVSNPYAQEEHNILTLDYYHRALSKISLKIPKEKIKIYIFSDDIAWVKERLVLTGYKVFYVSEIVGKVKPLISDAEEIHLMSICNHHVIANSSFSWWGAWLNPSNTKIVIAPKRWVKNPYINTDDVCPHNWVRI